LAAVRPSSAGQTCRPTQYASTQCACIMFHCFPSKVSCFSSTALVECNPPVFVCLYCATGVAHQWRQFSAL
jgi:hypothetical protein